MKSLCVYVCLMAALATSAYAWVAVSSPGNGATVGSPISFVASANTGCSRGVATMGIYVNNQLSFVSNGASLNTKLPLGAGTYRVVVEEWDYCGGASFTPLTITVANQTAVWVSSPANNSVVGSPVHFAATATTSTCPQGVASMGIYTAPSPNNLAYTVNGARLDTSLNLSPGTYNTVVEEWDFCGGAKFTPVTIAVVGGKTLSNLQATGGWKGWGELAPAYEICSSCSPKVTWGMNQTGGATKFSLGGTVPYSDALWSNPLIGQGSTQGIPDNDHSLVPSLKNFTYDAYFYSDSTELSQVLEFDISQYFNSKSFIWGNQCRIAGGHEWDIWDNVNTKWVSTGIPCHPIDKGWNHVVIQMQRTADNNLLYKSITFNEVPHAVNRYYAPAWAPSGWHGITLNFQMDGNYRQMPYTVFLDKLHFTYW